MDIEEITMGEILVLKLSGRLDALAAPGISRIIRQSIDKNYKKIIIDFQQVDLIDSSGLGSLVAALKSLQNVSGDLRISGARENVRELFQVTRLDRLFDIFDNIQAAASGF